MDGGVRCTVTKLRDGDKVSDEEKDEVIRPYACMLVSLCLFACVLMLTCLCPYAFVCVLILNCMCPYAHVLVSLIQGDKDGEEEEEDDEKTATVCPYAFMNVSTCFYACVLMLTCVCPYAFM